MVQLMMGGITPRHGFPLHCRLRYFDASRQRPGVPQGVAALVTVNPDRLVFFVVLPPEEAFETTKPEPVLLGRE